MDILQKSSHIVEGGMFRYYYYYRFDCENLTQLNHNYYIYSLHFNTYFSWNGSVKLWKVWQIFVKYRMYSYFFKQISYVLRHCLTTHILVFSHQWTICICVLIHPSSIHDFEWEHIDVTMIYLLQYLWHLTYSTLL